MNKLQAAPPIGSASAPGFYLKVRRGGRPPLPWTWDIHRAGEPRPYWQAVRGYRSAEDAWEAGQAELARRGVRVESPL